MVENREIMAMNIKNYMGLKEVSAAEICEALNIKPNTFSYWVNAKAYPRIDKIELMAKFFGISKADLVEDHYSDKSTIYGFTDEEIDIIKSYRKASPDTQLAVKAVLGVKNDSIASSEVG